MKKSLLWTLSVIYGALSSLRNWLYDIRNIKAYRSTLPVISVGNISVGGNAKTPLCIFLAQELAKRDMHPVILSRGYGGVEKGPHVVSSSDFPDLVGDEPYLMLRKSACPVVISRERIEGAKLIEREALGDVIILDDGLQHRKLARDVDIVSVNVSTENAVADFLQGKLLPLGLFRENRDKALKRVDMIVFADRTTPKAGRKLDKRLFDLVPRRVQLYRSFVKSDGVLSLRNYEILTRQPVAAFCAIANPESFKLTLENLGYKVSFFKEFIDHHVFTDKELEDLLAQAGDLPLICTEKDAVKLSKKYKERVYILPVNLEVAPKDAFIVQIIKMLTNAKTLRLAEEQSESKGKQALLRE